MSDGKVDAALDEIREHYAKAPASNYHFTMCATSVPRLLAALDVVLALHVPAVIEDARPPFRYCSRCSGHPGWPCPEVAAITGALLGEDGS